MMHHGCNQHLRSRYICHNDAPWLQPAPEIQIHPARSNHQILRRTHLIPSNEACPKFDTPAS
eukprot:1161674-Pelagomonas_calceolata.AAC.3